jgi:hypothetical protein
MQTSKHNPNILFRTEALLAIDDVGAGRGSQFEVDDAIGLKVAQNSCGGALDGCDVVDQSVDVRAE